MTNVDISRVTLQLDDGTTQTVHMGPVSEGTLRPEDVLAVYQREANWLNTGTLADCLLVDGALDENAIYDAMFDLHDAINEQLAGTGVWFGGHPDDPACIGYWPCEAERA